MSKIHHRVRSRARGKRLGATVAVAVSTLALLVLTGCGAEAVPGAVPSSGTPTPGGTLVVAVSDDAGCIDPQQVASNNTIYTTRQLVDSLTDQDPETGKIVPWLAEKWEVSPDSRSFTFHLRTDATFSDGTPVNAEAVKANFDAIDGLGANGTLALGYVSGYAGTKVVDDHTVTITFKQPNVQFLQATSTFTLGLLSVATTQQSAADRCSSVIGSGPFVLDSYTRNSSIVISKRKGYDWGSSLWKHTGEAYLDQVEYRIVPESGVRTGSLQSGQVDVIGSIGPQDEAAITASGASLAARANPGLVFGLYVNNARPIVKDPAVREAISAAINRADIATTTFPSQTKAATSVLASTTLHYASQENNLGFDASRAAQLLDEAGWLPGSDGIRVKDGQRLHLVALWSDNAATNKPTLELIQQQLRAAGVELELKLPTAGERTELLQSGNFDFSWSNITRVDPDILRSSFSTLLANSYRVPKTELDDLLTRQASETDETKRAELVAQAQELIVANHYAIPVVELTTVLGVGPKVHDLAFEASSRIQLYDTWKSA